MASDLYRVTPEGLEIVLKVTPKARQNKIVGLTDQGLKVQVTAAPEKGLANEVVVALLAKTCGVAKKCVTVISGDTARQKRILLHGDGAAFLALLKAL